MNQYGVSADNGIGAGCVDLFMLRSKCPERGAYQSLILLIPSTVHLGNLQISVAQICVTFNVFGDHCAFPFGFTNATTSSLPTFCLLHHPSRFTFENY